MATKVFTDAEMTFLFSDSNAGPDWKPTATNAWDAAASMNGATGLVTCAALPFPAVRELIFSIAFLDDDATVPPVVTVTNINFQFSWTIVTLGPSGPTDIGNSDTQTPVAAGGSGSYNEDADPLTYWGANDRSAIFSGGVLWLFQSTGASAQQSITVSGFTVTVTYTTPSTPAVTSITPSSGSVNGGQAVTIRGEGFTGALGAEIGGTAVTSFMVVDDTTATAVTAAHTSGTYDVEVLGVATGTDLYTYTLDRVSLPPMPIRTPMTQGGGKHQSGGGRRG